MSWNINNTMANVTNLWAQNLSTYLS